MTHARAAFLLGLAAAMLSGMRPASAQHYVFTTLDVPGQFITQTTGTPGSLNDHDLVVGSTLSQSRQYQGFVWSAGKFTLYQDCEILAAINDKGIAVGYPASGFGYCTVNAHSGKTREFPIHARGDVRLEGIDNAGAAVAQVEGTRQITKGLVLTGRHTDILQVPGSANKYGGTNITGINTAGTVVGYYSDAAAVVHGFTETAGVYSTFDVPGGTGTYAYFITDSGAVGGGYLTHGSGGSTVGFVLDKGVYTLIDVPNAQGSEAFGIGPSNEIVGTYLDASSVTHGFVNRGSTYLTIDMKHAAYTSVQGVNKLGSLVGSFRDTQQIPHAFIAQCSAGELCTP